MARRTLLLWAFYIRYEKNRIFHQLRVKSLIDVDFKFLKYIVSAIELLRHIGRKAVVEHVYTLYRHWSIWGKKRNSFLTLLSWKRAMTNRVTATGKANWELSNHVPIKCWQQMKRHYILHSLVYSFIVILAWVFDVPCSKKNISRSKNLGLGCDKIF